MVGDDIAGIRRANLSSARVEAVVAPPAPPLRHELIYALQIPAALRDGIAVGDGRTGSVVSQQAAFLAPEILALQLHIAVADVAVGRVFPDKVQSHGATVAAEAVAHAIRCREKIRHTVAGTIHRARLVQRSARAPAVFDADVVADMREQHARPGAVLRPVASREAASPAYFAADLDERIAGRQPFDLHAILAQLVLPQRGINQRLVGEIPRVGMLFVEIAQAGKITAKLEIQAVAQRAVLHIGIFHAHAAGRVECQRDLATIICVNVGGYSKFRLAEAEALVISGIGAHLESRRGGGWVLLKTAIGAP